MEQPTYGITDIGTWLNDTMENKVFRFETKKHIFTPYEQDKKFSDESIYEQGGYYETAIITKAIEVPNDVLIEFSLLYDEEDHWTDRHVRQYELLSNIKLMYFEEDNDGKEIRDE